MKLYRPLKAAFAAAAFSAAALTSCTDTIQFGSAALYKPSSNTVSQDTVFSNPEYTRQFVNTIYARQYYGLPFTNRSGCAQSQNHYMGKLDALTDCWQIHWADCQIYKSYYSGTMTANEDALVGFTSEHVWEAVRSGLIFLDNIERVPDMPQTEKNRLVAEVKCLMAARYFDLFQAYGGLPIVERTYDGTDASYEIPRRTVEETVNYLVNLLDEAINTVDLPWAYLGDDATNYTGRWTKAGAMALKCKILQFAASPIFNSDTPYYDGTTEAEKNHLVWYGNYDVNRWKRCLEACTDFFNALAQNGNYELTQASARTPQAYRQAFRKGYAYQGSKEILHSVRVETIDAFKSGTYAWHQWSENGRNSYCPTQEYVEMFPWRDGSPFNWEESANTTGSKKLDNMFLTGRVSMGQMLTNVRLERDPRLYESVRINGVQKSLGWDNGVMSGDIYETWVGGTDAQQNSMNETGNYATGYDNMKYYMGNDYLRKYTQWVSLSLNEMYLIYAEALLQANNDHTNALKQVDIVRSRVGLYGLARMNPTLNLTTDKDNLLNEILRERVCELALSNARYYDMVRYKRTDWMTKPLHGLLIYRMTQNSKGEWVRNDTPWTNGDKLTDASSKQPTHFEYEKFELKNRRRALWDENPNSNEVKKWLLSPLPQTEINKGYGLIQNPGW